MTSDDLERCRVCGRDNDGGPICSDVCGRAYELEQRAKRDAIEMELIGAGLLKVIPAPDDDAVRIECRICGVVDGHDEGCSVPHRIEKVMGAK